MHENVRPSISLTHEVQMDGQANLTSMPFEIAYLVGLVFAPPSAYIVPPFAVSALQAASATPPFVVVGLPLMHVAVVIHFSWSAAQFLSNLAQLGVVKRQRVYKRTC